MIDKLSSMIDRELPVGHLWFIYLILGGFPKKQAG